MNEINYENIIQRAEQRRADVKGVTEILKNNAGHYVGVLQEVCDFAAIVRNSYIRTDEEGKELIRAALYNPSMGQEHAAKQSIHATLCGLGLTGRPLSNFVESLAFLERGVKGE